MSAVIKREDGGFYLQFHRLETADAIDVELPFVGWRRGRFFTHRGEPWVLFVSGQRARLDVDVVDARWPESIPGFTCPNCRRTSHNANDVRQRYCGACHRFFDEVTA